MNDSSTITPPVYSTPPAGAPVPPAAKNVRPPKMSNGESSLIKIVVIVLLSLLLVGALLLAGYFYLEYSAASSDLDAQRKSAVLDAEKAQADKLEAEFEEREKLPFLSFSGPEDYGSLSFEYPKTWSVYISKDASSGGNFEAYLHPREVTPVSAQTINALRVTIENTTFESVSNRYASHLKNGDLKSSTITINGADATRYDGKFNSYFVGSVVIFKIRDKTVTLETDAEIYRDDFNKILETVTYNQ